MLNNVLNYAFYSNNSDISIVQNSIINFNNNIQINNKKI